MLKSVLSVSVCDDVDTAVLSDSVHELHSSAANGEHILHGTGMRPRWGVRKQLVTQQWLRPSVPTRTTRFLLLTVPSQISLTSYSHAWLITETPHDTTMSCRNTWVTGLSVPAHSHTRETEISCWTSVWLTASTDWNIYKVLLQIIVCASELQPPLTTTNVWAALQNNSCTIDSYKHCAYCAYIVFLLISYFTNV